MKMATWIELFGLTDGDRWMAKMDGVGHIKMHYKDLS